MGKKQEALSTEEMQYNEGPLQPALQPADEPAAAPAEKGEPARKGQTARHKPHSRTQCGIAWTPLEVMRGKADLVLICETVAILAVLGTSVAYWASLAEGTAPMIQDAIHLVGKAAVSNVSDGLVSLLVLALPVFLVVFVPMAMIVSAVLTIRDRNLPRTPENLRRHEEESRPHWSMVYSVVLGCFDLSLVLFVLNFIDSSFAQLTVWETNYGIGALKVLAALVISERRIINITQAMTLRFPATRDLCERVIDGLYDDMLPEDYRSDFHRLRIASLLSLGSVTTVRQAVWLHRAIIMRMDAMRYSVVFVSFFQAIINAFTLGSVGRVTTVASDMNLKLAMGDRDGALRIIFPPDCTPHLYFEAACVIALVLLVASCITDAMQLTSINLATSDMVNLVLMVN